MSVREIIDWVVDTNKGDLAGSVASPFYQYCPDGKNWVWACDVDIGVSVLDNGQYVNASDNPNPTNEALLGAQVGPTILQAVPVAANSQNIIYAQQGTPVGLKHVGPGKYVIVGLSKIAQGLGHILFVTFTEDIATVAGDAYSGTQIRPLTLGELGTLAPEGFGSLPLGSQGRFDANGNLLAILGT